MAFEEDIHQQHNEELEQLQKQKENEKFQRELDEIIARLENEQFQKELDEIIEHLDEQISQHEENTEEQVIDNQVSQQLATVEEEPASHDSVTEEELNQQNMIENPTQIFDVQLLSHPNEEIEERVAQNQDLQQIGDLIQESTSQHLPNRVLVSESSHQETTRDQKEELNKLQWIEKNHQFQQDLDVIIERLDQKISQNEENKEEQETQNPDLKRTDRSSQEEHETTFQHSPNGILDYTPQQALQTKIDQECREQLEVTGTIESKQEILRDQVKHRKEERVKEELTDKAPTTATSLTSELNTKKKVLNPLNLEKENSSITNKQKNNVDSIIGLGKRCIETDEIYDYQLFVEKWNEHISYGNTATKEMYEIYNVIQQTHRSPLRRFRLDTEEYYRVGYYYDLAEKLESFIEKRTLFPTKLYEYWLRMRGQIEEKKPFLEFDIQNPRSGVIERWYIPNRKYHWNPNYAYTYNPNAPQNRKTSGAGMVINFLMKEYPIKNDETRDIQRSIVNTLRKQGHSGRTNSKYWFKTIYKLKYETGLVDEVFSNTFWKNYTLNPSWRKPSDINRYPIYKKLLTYYENKSTRTESYSQDLIKLITVSGKGKRKFENNRNRNYAKREIKINFKNLGNYSILARILSYENTENFLKELKQPLKQPQIKEKIKTVIIPKLERALNEDGLQIFDQSLIQIVSNLRHLNIFESIGFIGNLGRWKVEIDWNGSDVIRKYLNSLIRPIKGFKVWAELVTDIPIYNETGKRLFYTLDLKDTNNITFLEKYIGKRLLIFNTAHMFGKDKGLERGVFYKRETVEKFINYFVEKISFLKSTQNDIQKYLIKEFHCKYGSIFDNFIKEKGRRPIVYVLKFDIDKIKNSWIREFHHWQQNYGNLRQFEDRKAQLAVDYFNSFCYSPSLTGESLDYIITVSQLFFDNLVKLVKNQKVGSIEDIERALIGPRYSSTQFINEYIGTKDVKPPLMVDTTDTAKFKDETKPYGQVAIVQSLFQKNEFIDKLNRLMVIETPVNGIYEFKGQTRGTKTTTTIYEDVSSVKDRDGNNLSKNVIVLIKNSTEKNKIRIIEDYFKSLHSHDDQSMFFLVEITHPNDLPKNITNLPNAVVDAIENYNEGRILGWIDIAVYKGDERFRNLSQIYGAIKYARSKINKLDYRKNPDHVISIALSKLEQHNVKNIDHISVAKMNSLFERHEVWRNPRKMKSEEFKNYIIDFIETFFV